MHGVCAQDFGVAAGPHNAELGAAPRRTVWGAEQEEAGPSFAGSGWDTAGTKFAGDVQTKMMQLETALHSQQLCERSLVLEKCRALHSSTRRLTSHGSETRRCISLEQVATQAEAEPWHRGAGGVAH